MFDFEQLKQLAALEPAHPVVSIFARTDPRDPANTSHNPAWEVALRNGLRALDHQLDDGDDRDGRQAFRQLHERIETELIELEPAERGRSVVWFLAADGETLGRFTLQLPLREDRVVWDQRPFVSPLVDVADRGAPVGIVLVGLENVRLLQIEQGEVSEPDHSEFHLELGDWRPYGGSTSGSPQRGKQTTAHEEQYEARVEAHREKLYGGAADATARRLEELGWGRIMIAAEGQTAAHFRAALPQPLADRVVAEADLNLVHDDPHVIAETLEPAIERAWTESAIELAEQARRHALAGGPGAIGLEETLGSLAEGRVEHLVLDPAYDFAAAGVAAGVAVPASIGGPAALLGERAVEAALGTSAKVTALPTEESARLAESGGIAALLRY